MSPYPPHPVRLRDDAAIIRKRNDLRRQVGITRLMQQGLTRFEAEEQFECRLWRRT